MGPDDTGGRGEGQEGTGRYRLLRTTAQSDEVKVSVDPFNGFDSQCVALGVLPLLEQTHSLRMSTQRSFVFSVGPPLERTVPVEFRCRRGGEEGPRVRVVKVEFMCLWVPVLRDDVGREK